MNGYKYLMIDPMKALLITLSFVFIVLGLFIYVLGSDRQAIAGVVVIFLAVWGLFELLSHGDVAPPERCENLDCHEPAVYLGLCTGCAADEVGQDWPSGCR